ncbi:hypothetical protein QQS21_004265 [Conoideocrella luteorostrata]|uniref:Tryptophan synthase beta chain-like PALP domain-containing protein n=1 Tax=Conoideocrella luteorostrata TaxID=1105319 RepID=A0AAJ0CSQ9_9HYPO|nr:hypothetical protein QQS21_004265 [Conoideocrella luteorostrata]
MVLLPEPFASIERTPLLFATASPLHPLPNLTRHVQSTTSTTAQIWAKREDCSSGLGLGGNKIRKLEYVLPSALAEACDTLISTGGVQSNHMRQVAAVGNHLGFKTVLVPQMPESVSPSCSKSNEAFEHAGNVQINRILEAEYHTELANGTAITSPPALDEVAADIRAKGGKPYIISSGASAHLHGGLGFARWAFEVVEQETALGVYFDTIVVPVASGGTLGGMIAGFKMADALRQASGAEADEVSEPRRRSRDIIGIDTYNKPHGVLEATVLEIAQRTAGLIGLGSDAVRADDVILDTRYNAGQHTAWDRHAANGVKLMAGKEGIVTDPIYSGRAIGAILHHAALGELNGREHVLFVHTGGQAALSAFSGMR